MRPLAWLALAALLPGSAAAQEEEQGLDDAARPGQVVTFYGHVFGNGLARPMPANTVFPEGDAQFSTWVQHLCFEDPSSLVATDCEANPQNKLVLFSTAGPVQIHHASDFTYEALHNERGHAKDVHLDVTQEVTATFYAAADYHSYPLLCPNGAGLPPDVPCPNPQWGWDPGIIPGFVVEATLYQATLGEYGQGASEPPPVAESIATAQVVARGATEPTTLQTGLPGSPNVMEFTVDLGRPQVPVLPKENDFFLVFSWYELVAGQKVGVQYMKPWAGELFPVRFTLPVRNPFDVELVIPQILHDKLVVHGVLSTPWGSYDIDLGSVGLELRDSAGRSVELGSVQRYGDYRVAHGAHFTPVNVTWVWDHRADGAGPGAYTATVRGCNFQHSACSETTGGFVLEADGTAGAISIGHSGQRTASEALLRRLAEAAEQAGPDEPVQPAEAGPPEPATQPVPGPPLPLGLALPALLALALRRLRRRGA